MHDVFMHLKNQYSFGNFRRKHYLQPHLFIYEMKRHENIEIREKERKLQHSHGLGRLEFVLLYAIKCVHVAILWKHIFAATK